VPEAVRWIGLGLGMVVVLGTAGSLVRTLILPRGLTSRLSAFVERGLVWKSFLFVANRFESYETKDRILALAGPVSLLALLVTWLVSYLLGFALILWPLVDATFWEALRESGSSLFTLGFAGTERTGPSIVSFIAAATGLIVVALQIAYLPTLYASFNRRETRRVAGLGAGAPRPPPHRQPDG
jgi:hypothetical protein